MEQTLANLLATLGGKDLLIVCLGIAVARLWKVALEVVPVVDRLEHTVKLLVQELQYLRKLQERLPVRRAQGALDKDDRRA